MALLRGVMKKNIEKRKVKKTLLISTILGIIVTVVFPIVDDMNWEIWVIPGSFLMGFLPVFIILMFNIFISHRYLAKMHGVLYLTFNSLIYFIIIVVSLIVTIITMGLSPDYEKGEAGITDILSHPDTLLTIIVMGVIILLIQIYMLLTSFLGKGMLFKLFFGIYHSPKEDEKIFMFLDVKSSTSIAEKIGHMSFLALLQEFFFDLSGAVSENSGEIYKYVGDEAIIVWDYKSGFKKSNFLKCFFMLKQIIESKSSFYKRKYGAVPEFKAGVHCGKVVVGEIGLDKKEITYLGDVLNSTARIEGECSRIGEDLIISGDCLDKIIQQDQFSTKDLGMIKLRGKDEKLQLHSVYLIE